MTSCLGGTAFQLNKNQTVVHSIIVNTSQFLRCDVRNIRQIFVAGTPRAYFARKDEFVVCRVAKEKLFIQHGHIKLELEF